MLSSKTLMLATTLFVAHHLSFSQKIVPDTIYHRNELSVNFAPAFSVFSSGGAPEAVLAIGYAHHFGRNHFLRAGIKIIPDIRRRDENTIDDYMETYIYNYNWKPNGNGAIIYDSLDANYYSLNESKFSLYLGYDHLVGKRKCKFLFGIELMVGFNMYSASQSTYRYDVAHTPDTINNTYQTSFTFNEHRVDAVRTIGLHLGFTPRLGMRYDLSKRIAFTVVYTPLFYFDMAPYQYVTPLNQPALKLYGGIFIADASLIVKL